MKCILLRDEIRRIYFAIPTLMVHGFTGSTNYIGKWEWELDWELDWEAHKVGRAQPHDLSLLRLE
jgi:hypothetical protein